MKRKIINCLSKTFLKSIDVISDIAGVLSCKLHLFRMKITGYQRTKPRNLGRKLVILGNGLSQDLFHENRNRFLDYDILCVNYMPLYMQEEFFQIKPKYLCIVDGEFFGDTKISDALKIREIINHVTWNLTIVTNSIADIDFITNSKIQIVRINDTPFGSESSKKFKLFNANQSEPKMNNVSHYSLFFGIVFGYKEIALFGIDQKISKMEVDENNVVHIYGETHNYDKEKMIVYKDRRDLSEILQMQLQVFQAFKSLSMLALYNGVQVINYSPHSGLNCFKKKILPINEFNK